MSEQKELKKAGLKVTHPRIKILSLFRTSEVRHLSAEEVFQILTQEQSEIGLATVYRVLMQLEEAGVLRRSSFSSNKAVVFELNAKSHHDHLICLGCGRTDEFNDPTIEKRQKSIADSFGYTLSNHRLELYGYCQECTAKAEK